jgi:hypothetical protein
MHREGLGLALACLLSAGMHLAHPNPEAHRHDVSFPGGVRYAFNADSALFARTVVRFPRGFWDCEQGKVRIMRPLYAALGRAVYLPLSATAPLLPESLTFRVRKLKEQTNHPEIWADVDERGLLVAWAALVVVNVAVTWSSGLLILRALARVFSRPSALGLALIALFHFDAVDFILVPHSEVFNLLVPAVTLDALVRGKGRPEPARGSALLLGSLMLGKALAFPILNWLRGRTLREGALLLGLFALPAAAYFGLLFVTGLPLYNHEVVAYRQGIWMLDFMVEGRGPEIPVRWARGLVAHLLNLARGFPVPLLAGLALLLRRRPGRPSPAPWLVAPLVLYGLACLVFWVLLGYDPPRLSVLHFPWVLAGLGSLAATRSDRPARLLAAVAALHLLLRFTGSYDI